MSRNESEIETERIERIAKRAAKEVSGEYHQLTAEHTRRLDELESAEEEQDKRIDEHGRQLSDGRVEFARLQSSIVMLTDAVHSLKRIVSWAGFGVVGVVGLSLINQVLSHPKT